MKKVFLVPLLFGLLLVSSEMPSWSQEGISVSEVRSRFTPHIERMEDAMNQMRDRYSSWQAVETLKMVLTEEDSGHPRAWGQWLYLTWSYTRDRFYHDHINILRQSISYARSLDSLGQDDMSYLEQGIQQWFQKEQQIQDAFSRLVENYSNRGQNLAAIARKNEQLRDAGRYDPEKREGREAEIEQMLVQLQTLMDERKEIEQKQEDIRDEIADLRTGLVFSSLNSSERIHPTKNNSSSILAKDNLELDKDEGSIMDQIESGEGAPELIGNKVDEDESMMNQIESGDGTPELIGELSNGEVPLNEEMETNLEEWEKDAAAAMAAVMSDAEGEEGLREEYEENRRFQDNQEARRNPNKIARNDVTELQNQYVDRKSKEEARLREERLRNLNEESLERMREDAKESMTRFENAVTERAEKEGREWTPEEEAELKRRSDRYADLLQPTVLESDEIAQRQAVNDRINRQLRDFADSLGRSSPEVVAERLQNAREFDAATKGWRDVLMTGEAVNQVQDDVIHQRELGIKANSDIIAAKAFLQRGGLTPEERHATEQFLERAMLRRHAAAEAIVVDGGVVLTGMALDTGTAALGGTISRGINALGKGVARYFGAKAGQKTGEVGARTLAANAGEETTQQATRTHSKTNPSAARVGGEVAEASSASPNRTGNASRNSTPLTSDSFEEVFPRTGNELETRRLTPIDELMSKPPRPRQPRPQTPEARSAAETHRTLDDLQKLDLGELPNNVSQQATRTPTATPPSQATQVQRAKDMQTTVDQLANHELQFADEATSTLRTQNQAAERELAERLAQQGDEAERAMAQARQSGVELSPKEAAHYQTQVSARNYNRQLNGLLEDARQAGVSEEDIRRAVEPAFSPEAPKRGSSIASQNVIEHLAQARGQQIVPYEHAESIMTTITNVQTGAAGRAEVEVLRQNIQAAESRGANFFDEVTRQGTIGNDGYQPLADDIDVEALKRFAQENGLLE